AGSDSIAGAAHGAAHESIGYDHERRQCEYRDGRDAMRIQHRTSNAERGSVLVLVLWLALGLVTLTIYFANSNSFELQAADNRTSGLAAEEAIDGAARYVTFVLANYATNGTMPDQTYYQAAAVPVGDAHFWLIGRDTNSVPVHPDQVFFGLT